MTITIPLPDDANLAPDVLKTLAQIPPANIFRMVANAPASLQGFVLLAGSILLQSELNPRQREIAVLRTAHLTRSRYEWEHHVRIAMQAGVTREEIALIGVNGLVQGLPEGDQLVCRVAEEICRDIRLSDETLQATLDRYGTRQTTELILCCSYFNMISRFLESTRVPMDANIDALHAQPVKAA